jgi:hydrogenase maturation protease
MIDMMGDLPPTKIVGVIPYVIGEDSTFQMTDEVIKASRVMERAIMDYVRTLGVEPRIINDTVTIEEIAPTTYIKGTPYDPRV